MANNDEPSAYRVLTDAAMKAMQEDGWSITKAPGHGRSNAWNIEKNGKSGRVSIRTTQNRWIAYQPQNGGKNWKTLDDADYVCISAFDYDDDDDPTCIDVHFIKANTIRDAFNRSYKARTDDGASITDDFGMWTCMDECEGDRAVNVGSGFATDKNMIASYSLDDADNTDKKSSKSDLPSRSESRTLSVSAILDDARTKISRITGIAVDSITLDLHLKA